MRWRNVRRIPGRTGCGAAAALLVLFGLLSAGCATKGLVADRYPPDYRRVPNLLESYALDHDPLFIVYGDNRPGWRVKEMFYRKKNWWTWKQFIFPFYQVYWLGNGVLGTVNVVRRTPDYGGRQARRVRDAAYIVANRMNVDFFVSTGDMATDGRYPDTWKTFIEQNKEEVPLVLEYPYLPVLGNHERTDDTLYGMPNYRAVFEQDPFYVVRCPNVDLIIIDSSLIVDHWGYIDDDTQEALFEKWFVSNENSPEPSWLERQLQNSDKTFKLVFMHVPPIVFAGHYTNWTDPDKGRDLAAKRYRLLELLAKYDVRVVFSGHQHSYEHNMLNRIGDTRLERDMHFVVTGGAGSPLHPGLDADKIAKLESDYRSHGLWVVSKRQYVAYNFCVVRTGAETMSIDVYEVPDRENAPAELIDQVIIESTAR